MTALQKPTMKRKNFGFTLIELAIVMLVIGLLVGGLLAPLSAQIEQQRFSETRSQIEEVKRALIGFAIANGRLPCPAEIVAAVAASGVEAPVGGGPCASPHGFVPAVTLGLNNNGGFVLDGWSNSIRYSVATTALNTPLGMVANAFTTAPKLGNMSMTNLTSSLQNTSAAGSGLYVCSSSTGIVNVPAACAANSTQSNDAVAVIYSLGKNGAVAPTLPDELENTDNDRFFVSHTPDNNFDDQVTWLSYSILFGQMVAAGQLP